VRAVTRHPGHLRAAQQEAGVEAWRHQARQHAAPKLPLGHPRLEPAQAEHEVGELVGLGQESTHVVVTHVLVPVALEVLEQQERGDQPADDPVAPAVHEELTVRAPVEHRDLEQAGAAGRRDQREGDQRGRCRAVGGEARSAHQQAEHGPGVRLEQEGPRGACARLLAGRGAAGEPGERRLQGTRQSKRHGGARVDAVFGHGAGRGKVGPAVTYEARRSGDAWGTSRERGGVRQPVLLIPHPITGCAHS
jgi:hypothetical protein